MNLYSRNNTINVRNFKKPQNGTEFTTIMPMLFLIHKNATVFTNTWNCRNALYTFFILSKQCTLRLTFLMAVSDAALRPLRYKSHLAPLMWQSNLEKLLLVWTKIFWGKWILCNSPVFLRSSFMKKVAGTQIKIARLNANVYKVAYLNNFTKHCSLQPHADIGASLGHFSYNIESCICSRDFPFSIQ